jgi:two-component system LytT family sensor kinase
VLYRFPLIFFAWLVYGLLTAALVHYRFSFTSKPMSWGITMEYEVSYAVIWALATPGALWVGHKFHLGRSHLHRNLLIHTLAAFVFGCITKLTWDFLILARLEPSRVPHTMQQAFESSLKAMDFGILHYAVIILCQHAIEYYSRYQEGQLRASQLETKLATAQLHALKMQLHPHFLFNTLHSISELVHSDPNRAETMIVRLSEFLRMTLEHVGHPEVTLREEIDFLERYLHIEKMRFEDRLTLDISIDPASLDAKVPNLLLQPIIENALRHGISHKQNGGLLRISSKREGDTLTMQVFDNGPGPQAQPHGQFREGVGLNNTRSRLQRLYGGEHKIAFKKIPDCGFEVTIQIPYRLTSTAPVASVNL